MTKNIAAAILAGGYARRLDGLAKGNILLNNGLTIIEHLLAELDKVGIQEVIIVSKNPAYQCYNKLMIADKRQHVGPLAGIEAALFYYQGNYDATLFLPCDMPNFSANEMCILLNKYQSKDLVFAVTSNKDCHPLCAVIDNVWLNKISVLISQGERSVKEALLKCGGKPIFFEDGAAFFNVNSLNDIVKLNIELGIKKRVE